MAAPAYSAGTAKTVVVNNTADVATPSANGSKVVAVPVPVPNFADIAKPSNDLLTKDFYHLSAAALEVKSSTPNNVAFKITGKGTHESATSGAVEVKYTDKPNGLTLTQNWNTVNALVTKVELKDYFSPGLKFEGVGNFLPNAPKNNLTANLNLHYQNPNFHGRAMIDLAKPTANIDLVLGQQGLLIGGSVVYDIQKAAVTNYGAALSYIGPRYTTALVATNQLNVVSASYYHKVNSLVEAGAKATWDSKSGDHVGLELASKYRLDPTSFAKAKINDRGIAAIAYNVLLAPGTTLGLGASFDTQKLDQSAPKIGASFTFDG